ncbi:MAG: NAD(P)H-hydrate epimerase [Rickettsiales bacterium]|jgi:NAD(P)H-hydrate epimerase
MNLSLKDLSQSLKRQPNANKNNCGHVLIIGSDYFFGGAVIMAAEAAVRCGAGKVTILTRKENFTAILSRLPNVMTADFDQKDVFANKDVIVIGPGLGKSGWAKRLLAMVLESNLPKIIDADALNIISQFKEVPNLENCIITPHSGEAARLLGISSKEVDLDRKNSIKQLCQKFSTTAILKGSGTLVLGKTNKIHQCQFGNSGMAAAGMGDTLSGIIGAFVAQKLNLEEAAIFGVDIHSFAGDLVAKKQGEIGMIPSDLLEFLPQIINGKI